MENAVGTAKELGSIGLIQSGLNGEWWFDSMHTGCFLHNVHDKLADGETPYEKTV